MVYAHVGEALRPSLLDADEATWAAVGRTAAKEGAQSLLERRPPKFDRLGG